MEPDKSQNQGTENDDSIRRRILDICRDQTRNVVEITRELALMTDSVGEGKGKDAKDHYQNMVKILDNFEGTKKKLLEEVASFGALLSNREDFIRLIFRVGEVADYAQGIGYRLTAVIDRSWKVDKRYTKRHSELIGTRLIIWDYKSGLGIYRSGFFGKPVGIPKPKPDQDFEVPLLLDLMEGLYLLEHKRI